MRLTPYAEPGFELPSRSLPLHVAPCLARRIEAIIKPPPIDFHCSRYACLMPDAAQAYRGLVHQLRGDARGLLTDGEYAETRALVFEMLGNRVPVKALSGGSASLTMIKGLWINEL